MIQHMRCVRLARRFASLTPLALALVLVLGSMAGCQAGGGYERAAPFDGPLTGREMLLQLEDPSVKRPSGIYALDPLTEKPEPRLLFRYGERPVWNPARTHFAYLSYGSVFVARTDGRAWCVLSPPSTHWDRTLRAPETQLRWTANGILLAIAMSDRIGQFAYPVVPWLPEQPQPGEPGQSLGTPLPPVLALAQPATSTTDAWNCEWSELLIVRDMDCAPDGATLVTQEAPFLPYGLGNERSKLISCIARPTANYEPAEYHFARGASLGANWADPKPLSRLPDGLTELAPRWSPTGDWVAFTVVNTSEAWVGPFVVRRDGSDATPLWLPTQSDQADAWVPPGPAPSASSPAGWTTEGWGQSLSRPVEWSDDGRYLLVEVQRHYKSEQVAKGSDFPSGGHFLARCEEGKWQMKAYSCRWSPGGSWPSPFDWVGGRAVLGPPVTEGVLPSLAVYSPDSVAMRTAHDEGPGRTFDIGDSFRILWLDW